MTKLFVGNIPFETTEEQLKQHFEQIGEVSKATLVYDRETNKPRGFGFVEMPNDEDAQQAMRDLSGQELFGRPLDVQPSRERTRDSRSQGNGGGYRQDDRRGQGGFRR